MYRFRVYARLSNNTRLRCIVNAQSRIDAIRWARLTLDLRDALITAVVKQ